MGSVAPALRACSHLIADAIVADDDVTDALVAVWIRAVEMDGRSVPAFGTTPLVGDIDFVILEGRAPWLPTRWRWRR